MDKHITDIHKSDQSKEMAEAIKELTFIKNFRSATAEEWYVFLPGYHDPKTGGAAGKVIVHYELQGNRDVFIQTTIILLDPKLHEPTLHSFVYAIGDEIVNRIVGFADTLLAVHAGENSYDAEYVQGKNH